MIKPASKSSSYNPRDNLMRVPLHDHAPLRRKLATIKANLLLAGLVANLKRVRKPT